MKNLSSLALLGACVVLVSCGSAVLPESELSVEERSLLTALNDFRASEGQQPLQASASLTALAREDAQRRAKEGSGYIDNRTKTGYERMLTLAGKARAGDKFGATMLGFWQKSELQRQGLKGSYSGVGVGSATGSGGLETAVVLLGGFSGGI